MNQDGRASHPETGERLDTLLARARIVPVLSVDDAGDAGLLAQALSAGGAVLAEVTLRTPAALDAIRVMAGAADLVVGAGTVLSEDDVDACVEAGARFVVTPGLSTRVVRRCRERGVPVLPGVATATEVQAVRELGLRTVKLFPAGPLGGPATVRALAAPFGDVRFVPTGGIGPQDLDTYLDVPAVLAVGGSWVAPRDLVTRQDWAEITRRTAEVTGTGPLAPAAGGGGSR